MVTIAKPCVCDGRYEGCDHKKPCGQPNDGTHRGPWCAECNPRRLDNITRSLDSLLTDLGS